MEGTKEAFRDIQKPAIPIFEKFDGLQNALKKDVLFETKLLKVKEALSKTLRLLKQERKTKESF